MDFEFTQEQQEIRELARRILGREVSAATLAAYDDYASERFDADLWHGLGSAGLLGIGVAQQYGGMAFDFFATMLLMEEAGRSLAPLPLAVHVGCVLPVLTRFGSTAQQERLLPRAVDGSIVLSAALGETGTRDPLVPTLRATADGAGYRLHGTHFAVPFAHRAERILLGASTAAGVVMLLLDPRAPGVRLQPMLTSSYEPQSLLDMENVFVAGEDVLAGPQQGAESLRYATEHMTVALCAHQLGVCEALLDQTASYTTQRRQFGVPIATFQAVGNRAADRFIDVECLRLTTWHAAERLACGAPAAVEVDIAKIWAGDVGHRCSYTAQHLQGGAGVDRGNATWRYCQWARHNEMTLGSSASRLATLGERCVRGEAMVD